VVKEIKIEMIMTIKLDDGQMQAIIDAIKKLKVDEL